MAEPKEKKKKSTAKKFKVIGVKPEPLDPEMERQMDEVDNKWVAHWKRNGLNGFGDTA